MTTSPSSLSLPSSSSPPSITPTPSASTSPPPPPSSPGGGPSSVPPPPVGVSSSPSPSPSPSIPPSVSSVLSPPTSSPPSTTTTSTSALPATSSSTIQTPTKSVATVTQTKSSFVTEPQPSSSSTGTAVRTASKSFLQNKAAVGATFAIVGLIVAALLFALVTAAIRRRRAKRFDREIAEEAKRAPAPVFLDDDEYNNPGYSSYDTPQADPYAAHAVEYPASDAVHSTSAGTAPNYMYPSGYSDLGFSDVSSQGTYAQPPMDGQYNPAYAGYGSAAGAYEMTQYAQGQPQQEWGGHQGAFTYPGEEAATGYPPMAADPLARSKSGARGMLDSSYSGSPPPQADPSVKSVPVPQYADGYVAQYQTHAEDGTGAYGGMESMHGHVGGLEEEGEEEEYNDGRRVLKVANE